MNAACMFQFHAICYMFIMGVSVLSESVLATLWFHTVSDYRSTERNPAFTYT